MIRVCQAELLPTVRDLQQTRLPRRRLPIAAVGDDLVDDLVDSGNKVLVALGNDGCLTEGSLFCGELEVGDFELAVAGCDQSLADRLVDNEACNVAVLGFQRQRRILFKLKELTVGKCGEDQLGLDGALMRADLLTGKRFLGGILVRIAGLDDQQLRAGLIEVEKSISSARSGVLVNAAMPMST